MSKAFHLSPSLWLLRLMLFSLLLVAGGCSTVPNRAKTPLRDGPRLVERIVGPYTIAVLDEIRFRVGKESILAVVAQDGTIDLNGQPIKVAGLQKEQLPAVIKRVYPAAREIEITEFRPNRISVLGEVFHQLHAQLDDGPMRVMDGIAAANGFTPLANKKRVTLIRQNAGTVEVYELDLREMMHGINLSQNILLKAGDIITVPRNFL